MSHISQTLEQLRKMPGYAHPRFGDLSRPGAVVIGKGRHAAIIEKDPLFIHLTVTGRCNARCEGCINTHITLKDDGKRDIMTSHGLAQPERDSKAILALASREAGEVILCFYGGEPLMAPEVMDAVCCRLEESPQRERFRYLIYTNGELLDSLIEKYPDLARKIWLYAIGIDGQSLQHDAIKRGTHLAHIHKNIEKLSMHCAATILMWSTLREEQSLLDCWREFLYLFGRNEGHQFFWHWAESDRPFTQFEGFLETYEQDLRQILDDYASYLENNVILPITHINELILYLLTGMERGTSACAVERSRNFDIMNGRIHACADLPPEMAIGEIGDDGSLKIAEHELLHLVDYKVPLGCYQCGIHAYCGGRCPVQAHSGDPERLLQYCQLMRVHTGTVMEYLPRLEEGYEKAGLTLQDIYDQSAFYAQLTDVTP